MSANRSSKRTRSANPHTFARRALITLGILLAALAHPVSADTFFGRVVGVADGDTVTVLDAGRQQHKIRLGGIDAPEKAQPFGEKSKQNLSRLVFGKDVRVEWAKRDRYARNSGGIDSHLFSASIASFMESHLADHLVASETTDPIWPVVFLQSGQSAKSRFCELECFEAEIRQNILAIGMSLFVGPYYHCIFGQSAGAHPQ